MVSFLLRISNQMIYVTIIWIMLLNKSADAQQSSQPTSPQRQIWIGEYPPGCDPISAQHCEDDYLNCILYNGPANDAATICSCSTTFYSSCLPLAGCETASQVGPFTNHEIYLKTCVDVIRANNCSDSTICSINCASNGPINATTSHILPINNYGNYYLRIRVCMDTVHPQYLKRYSTINTVFCKDISDFTVCSRFIPPHSFIPVAIPKSASSIVIDSCENVNGTYICHSIDPAPQRLYGNKFMFLPNYDVPVPYNSSCSQDSDCLGSFCDLHRHPHLCSPKSLRNVLGPGSMYFADPYGG